MMVFVEELVFILNSGDVFDFMCADGLLSLLRVWLLFDGLGRTDLLSLLSGVGPHDMQLPRHLDVHLNAVNSTYLNEYLT